MARDRAVLPPEAALDELGRIRLSDHSMDSVLDEIVRLARQGLAEDIEASVTLIRQGSPFTAAYSGDLAKDLDEQQYGRGDGPCLEAATHGRPVTIPDTAADDRWPDYLRVVRERGCRSVMSLPFPVQEQLSGGLNVYGRGPAAVDGEARGFAERFASYAAVVAGNMLAYEQAREQAQNLQIALKSRAVIDQAKGVLMERFKLTADQAFQTLARLSMEGNTKVRAVAEHVVTTGEVPKR
ncbi:GAF and ANTAR domain-containing protein [Blastococcus sp. LR1]|uniref:GAF and ANTAR domain-containing protein n=1 Tax=Blastococcus sp. LR1 TaxID=2877000 RepID=UPI001CCB6E6A|nr:GAF and ANTAR domain-containing protein [Blastococcus sp. LR1]MCA0145177.1 GAF and ANTAR domain-containing protein [Blastococcus sp. LR1]